MGTRLLQQGPRIQAQLDVVQARWPTIKNEFIHRFWGGMFPLPFEKGNASKGMPEKENTETSKKTVSKVRGISK